ncbi:MAG: polysaccharide biosynthesis tyrosine autokinase, partial [Bacteroidaceae bacterium]|nr:polysaccharide biosynthesis tyrosine autokinase [Bacteroidaceae bacterium]
MNQTEETLNVKDFLYMCLAKWYWFLLSMVLTLSIAMFYILMTQPTYTRSSQVMIKSDSKGASIGSAMSDFSNMGMLSTATSVDNELIAIQSPSVMSEVVKRLQLDMNYSVDGTFHKKTVYGKTLPVNVRLMEVEDNAVVNLVLDINEDGTVSLYDFVWYVDGDKQKQDDAVVGKMLEPIETPVGKIVVTPTLNYIPGVSNTIYVNRKGYHAATQSYSSRLMIALSSKKADVLDLSFTDVSPQRAVDVLNNVVEVYNEKWVDDKNKVTVSTSKFIEERLDSIVKELGGVDDNISSYKSRQLLPDVASVSNLYMAQSTKAAEEILALNNQLQMSRYILGYVKDESNNDKLLPANSGLSSMAIESQISEYNDMQLRRASMLSGGNVKNPIIDDLDNSLASTRKAIISSVENQIVTLQTQIDNMKRHEAQATDRIAANPKQEKYLISVGREQKVKEALYLFLLQKREENELSKAFTAYNTRIITPPTGSIYPTAPVKSKIWLVAFVLGLAIPAGVIFLRENLITTVRGRRDLEALSLPLIGEIPMVAGKRPMWKFWAKGKGDTKQLVVVQDGNRDVINEAFRVMRTNVEFLKKSDSKNVFVVTSFNPGSGKSFLAMNLAKALALKGCSVIVVDGDLRHASTSAYVNAPRRGISDYLAKRVDDFESVIVKSPEHDNLSVLPVGSIPPNPSELLEDARLGECIEKLRAKYDYVFIDCPPIDIVADTQIIEAYAD